MKFTTYLKRTWIWILLYHTIIGGASATIITMKDVGKINGVVLTIVILAYLVLYWTYHYNNWKFLSSAG